MAVLYQVLVRTGREDQAMMTTFLWINNCSYNGNKEVSSLFQAVRTMFNL